MITIAEGETAHLTVARTDGGKSGSVSYRTVNGTALPNDYQQVCVCC